MARNTNFSDKLKLMDSLLKDMNKNVYTEKDLLKQFSDLINSGVDLFKTIEDSAKKQYASRSNIKGSDSIAAISNNVVDISNTLLDIKDILNSSYTTERHDRANPLRGIVDDKSDSFESRSNSSKLSKLVGLTGKILTAFNLAKMANMLGQQIDANIRTGFQMNQLTGQSKSEVAGFKSTLNEQYGNSSIYNIQEEYNRLPQIIASTGMDDMSRLTRYVKAISVGVESMDLNVGDLSEIMYTMEKRGTFTNDHLMELTDTLYKYSAASGNVTPEEISKLINQNATMLSYAGKNLTQEDRLKETDELAAIMTTVLDSGVSNDVVSQVSTILESLYTEGTLSQYTQALGYLDITMEDINATKESGDISKGYSMLIEGIAKETKNRENNPELMKLLFEAFGINNNLQNQVELAELTDTDFSNAVATMKELADSESSAEDSAEDFYRSWDEKLKNVLSNFFTPVSDKLGEWGIGSSVISGVGAFLGSFAGGKLLGSGIDKVKGLFSGGKDSASSVASEALKGASLDKFAKFTAEDVAKSLGTTTEDVINTLGDTAKYSLDDIAKGLGSSVDEVSKVMISSSDDLASSALNASKGLGGLSKGIPVLAAAVSVGSGLFSAYSEYKEGDYEGAAESLGGGIGAAAGGYGGALAGAALGTAILPGVGTIIGGILGGLGGSYGGDWLGSKLGGGIYNLFSSNDEEDIPSYDVGTPYVPEDGLVYAHQGEAIIPQQYNPVNNINTIRNISNQSITKSDISVLKDAINEIRDLMKRNFEMETQRYEKTRIDTIIKNNTDNVRSYTQKNYLQTP